VQRLCRARRVFLRMLAAEAERSVWFTVQLAHADDAQAALRAARARSRRLRASERLQDSDGDGEGDSSGRPGGSSASAGAGHGGHGRGAAAAAKSPHNGKGGCAPSTGPSKAASQSTGSTKAASQSIHPSKAASQSNNPALSIDEHLESECARLALAQHATTERASEAVAAYGRALAALAVQQSTRTRRPASAR
jgi:hypothetical protein